MTLTSDHDTRALRTKDTVPESIALVLLYVNRVGALGLFVEEVLEGGKWEGGGGSAKVGGLSGSVSTVVEGRDLGSGELVAVPGAELGDGTVEEIVFALVRPDAVVVAGERIGLVGVCHCLAQHLVLVDAHGRAADDGNDVRSGKLEASGVVAKTFII